MGLDEAERRYYSQKFNEELERTNREEIKRRTLTHDSFLSMLKEIIHRIAPGLWDKFKDIFATIFSRI